MTDTKNYLFTWIRLEPTTKGIYSDVIPLRDSGFFQLIEIEIPLTG